MCLPHPHFLVVQRKEETHSARSGPDRVCEEGRTAEISGTGSSLQAPNPVQILPKTREAWEGSIRAQGKLQESSRRGGA